MYTNDNCLDGTSLRSHTGYICVPVRGRIEYMESSPRCSNLIEAVLPTTTWRMDIVDIYSRHLPLIEWQFAFGQPRPHDTAYEAKASVWYSGVWGVTVIEYGEPIRKNCQRYAYERRGPEQIARKRKEKKWHWPLLHIEVGNCLTDCGTCAILVTRWSMHARTGQTYSRYSTQE